MTSLMTSHVGSDEKFLHCTRHQPLFLAHMKWDESFCLVYSLCLPLWQMLVLITNCNCFK